MKFSEIVPLLDAIPYTSPHKGRQFYDFVMYTRPEQCLELGFAHGVSSCYIAAALHELGRGHLTTVDLESSRERHPAIENLLSRTGLESYVTVVREKTGYNWFLKKEIERSTRDGVCQPAYDFCFVDGAKNWTIDGFAFFLLDKLLNEGGWILFDDYSWSYREHAQTTGTKVSDGINHEELSDEEMQQPHIEAVFRNLVFQHPHYANFRVVDDCLAYAQKTQAEVRKLSLETKVSPGYRVVTLIRKMLHRRQPPRAKAAHVQE